MKKTMISGLAVGAGLAATLVIWLFKASSTIVFETDEAKTLGLQFESLPQVALRPLSLGELAKRLGVKDEEELSNLTQVFAQRITSGYLPKDWEVHCRESYHRTLCAALDDYFDAVKSVRPGAVKKPRSRVPIDVKNIKALQLEDFNALVSRLPDWNLQQFSRFAELALKTPETVCPHNLSLSLARKVEVFLPDAQAWVLLARLQSHGIACLTPDNSGAEFNYLRAALFEIAKKNYVDAIAHLEKAKVAEVKREEYRTLFWLARSYSAVGKERDARATRNELFRKYPISWHTILLKTETQVDPLEQFLKYPAYTDKYEAGDDLVNLRVLWLQALLEVEASAMAAKKYGEFVAKRLNPSVDPGLLQYISRCFDRAGFHRLQIIALNQLIFHRPENITRESLRLLYPKPFYTELDRNSPHLDTALLLGLARQESAFDPTATSTANAQGLLQILPSTAKGVNRKIRREDLYDYAKNIEIGARYIMQLIRYFDGSVEKSLGAYNAGQGSVRKWENRYAFVDEVQLFLDIVPFRETRDYVPAILRNAYWYHRLFPEMTAALSEVVATSDLLKKQLFPEKPFLESSWSSLNQQGLFAPSTGVPRPRGSKASETPSEDAAAGGDLEAEQGL